MLYGEVKHFALHRIILIQETSMPAIRHLTRTAAEENKYSGFRVSEAVFFRKYSVFFGQKATDALIVKKRSINKMLANGRESVKRGVKKSFSCCKTAVILLIKE